jgi:hypothetical protein
MARSVLFWCRNGPKFSIANSQLVLPLAEVTFETHAFGDLKA